MTTTTQRRGRSGVAPSPVHHSHGAWFSSVAQFLCIFLWCGPGLQLLGAESEESSLAGVYRDEQVMVELSAPTRHGNNSAYTGTIQVDNRKLSLRAEGEENRIKGTFESQGDQFEFEGTVVGRVLVLTTDGTTYRLKKQNLNPLARPAPRSNPLSSTRPTNAAPISAPSARTTPAPQVKQPVAPPRGPVARWRTQPVLDDPSMIGGEALQVTVPQDWRVDGGVVWRVHPSLPAYLAMRMSAPDRHEVVEILPTIPFVWAEGGIPLFPAGSIYLGNEVGEPIADPVVYIKNVILRRFRGDISQGRFVSSEELPALAAAVGQNTQEPGLEKKFRAGRVRIEHVEGGRVMEEDIYCVLVAASAPAIRTTFWGPDRNYSFRAEKGKLDGQRPVYQAIVNSVQPSLHWFNRYVQLVQILSQVPIDTVHNPVELSRYLASTTGELNEVRRQLFERQLATKLRVNAQLRKAVPGLEEYRNPFSNLAIELPAGHRALWGNPLGEYLMLEDANYDPNGGGDPAWRRLEPTNRTTSP